MKNEEANKNKRSGIARVIFSAAVIALLGALGLAVFISPDRRFSPNENRYLAERPAWSFSSFVDGGFQPELQDYLSDQFPFRDSFMAAGTGLKIAGGRRDIGDTYIGADHYFFEKVTEADIDMGRFETNLRIIERLASGHPETDFSVMLVPSSGIVLSDLLPAYAEMYDAASMLDTAASALPSCRLVDPTEELLAARSSGEQVFYRTDHHWTEAGAHAAYECLTDGSGQYTESADGPLEAGNDFYGSLWSRTLDASALPDTIRLPRATADVTVTADGSPCGLYDMSMFEEKDQYRVFQGGNHGIVEIAGSGSGTLLIIKDSFANSFVPYLAADYARIIMIDPRYYAGSVSAFFDAEEIGEVLVLYELNNFANSADVSKLVL